MKLLTFLSLTLLTSLANGQVCFNSRTSLSADYNSIAICKGDFNGDSIVDLAVANKQGTISVFIGNGNGAFAPAVNYPIGFLPISICAGDFDNDSIQDLATANGGPWNITAIYGDGSGAFSADSILGQITSPTDIVAGDFNNDGLTDFATTSQYNVSVYMGTGVGQFSAAVTYATGHPYSSIIMGNFNNDSFPDLAMTTIQNNVVLLFGSVTGVFSQPSFIPTHSSAPTDLASADFNTDGKMDIAISIGSADSVTILFGDGTGLFPNAIHCLVGGDPISITTGDFNHDNKPDIATANQSSMNVSVLVNDGTGNFSSAITLLTDSFPKQIIAGDFNGDKFDDISVITCYTNIDTGFVNVYLNCTLNSVAELNNENAFSIYPNPSAGEFKINFEKQNFSNGKIRIYNDLGEMIYSKNELISNVNLNSQPPGIYYVQLIYDGQSYCQKLILN